MVIGNDYVPHVLPPCVLVCQQYRVGNSKQQCTVINISTVINVLHEPAVVQGCPSVFYAVVNLAFHVNQ